MPAKRKPEAEPVPPEAPGSLVDAQEPPEAKTLAEIFGRVPEAPEEPSLPGFEMSDEVLPLPQVELAHDSDVERTVPTPVMPSNMTRTGTVRYQSRIEVLEAFQYPGNVVTAPDWIDRNWIGFADTDALRGLPPGPCLRIPVNDTVNPPVVECRIGDYVCQQAIMGDDGIERVKVEVWSRQEFEKIFKPTTSNPQRTPAPLELSAV